MLIHRSEEHRGQGAAVVPLSHPRWGDLLISYCGRTNTYDAVGNPLSYYNGRRYTFTWENGRRLATAEVGENVMSFTYNDEGIRTSKTVNGTLLYLSFHKLMESPAPRFLSRAF